MRFTGVEFVEQHIALDGHRWIGCEFTRCTIHFTAEDQLLELHGCHFQEVQWAFDGAAARTFQMLRALHLMGASPVVEQIFTAIRAPEPAS